jgi:hypothetical protein
MFLQLDFGTPPVHPRGGLELFDRSTRNVTLTAAGSAFLPRARAVLDAEHAAAAGFEPIMGPAFTTDRDTLAAIGTGPPSWTVFYAAQAEITPTTRTVFRPFAEPVPTMPALLAVRPSTPAHRLADLIAACQEQ